MMIAPSDGWVARYVGSISTVQWQQLKDSKLIFLEWYSTLTHFYIVIQSIAFTMKNKTRTSTTVMRNYNSSQKKEGFNCDHLNTCLLLHSYSTLAIHRDDGRSGPLHPSYAYYIHPSAVKLFANEIKRPTADCVCVRTDP